MQKVLKLRAEKRGQRSERGASAVEFAIAALVLIPLLFGIADFGILWQKRQTNTAAARTAARSVAKSCQIAPNNPQSTCFLGNEETSDFTALVALRSALGGSAEEVERVVIYRATSQNGAPSETCRTGAPSVADSCNVYTRAQVLETDATSLSTALPKFGCGLYAQNWCPKTRERRLSLVEPIGVYIRLRHPHVTGLFGKGVVVEDHAVFRLEPNLSIKDDPVALPSTSSSALAPAPSSNPAPIDPSATPPAPTPGPSAPAMPDPSATPPPPSPDNLDPSAVAVNPPPIANPPSATPEPIPNPSPVNPAPLPTPTPEPPALTPTPGPPSQPQDSPEPEQLTPTPPPTPAPTPARKPSARTSNGPTPTPAPTPNPAFAPAPTPALAPSPTPTPAPTPAPAPATAPAPAPAPTRTGGLCC